MSYVHVVSDIVEFELADGKKKVGIDRQHLAALEESDKGTKIHIGSGAIFAVTEDYETVAARFIHTNVSKITAREALAKRPAVAEVCRPQNG
jgi:hypothetical protein